MRLKLTQAPRGLWRLIQPMRNSPTREILRLPSLYKNYFKDFRQFLMLGGAAELSEISPMLFDKNSDSQSGLHHYCYQDVWALSRLHEFHPAEHHDFGSRLDGFVAQATVLCPVIYWDIRPPTITLPRLCHRTSELPHLPLQDRSVMSASSLHVLEHIGLGRYGDKITPLGTELAISELARVLAPGGRLLLSLPIGRPRTCFNAHRISDPWKPIELLSDLKLLEFSAVNDQGDFLEAARPDDFVNAVESCGLYLFERSLPKDH